MIISTNLEGDHALLHSDVYGPFNAMRESQEL